MSDVPEMDLLDAECPLSPEDEDPEILQAALAFIDTCDSEATSEELDADLDDWFPLSLEIDMDVDVDATVTATPTMESVASPTVDAPKPRTKTRNRRKEEIAELRLHVAELERKLAGTKRKFRSTESLTSSSSSSLLLPTVIASDGNDVDDTTNGDTIWEIIAQRQRQQRRLAEIENTKLRTMVMDQLKIARELTSAARLRHESPSPPLPSSSSSVSDMNNGSSLLVTIYPTRPKYLNTPTVNTTMPVPAGTSSSSMVDEPWKSKILSELARSERAHVSRIVWSSVLRLRLAKRSSGRFEDVMEQAVGTGPTKTLEIGGLDHGQRLVYTHRYNEHTDDQLASASRWRPSGLWQSPMALMAALVAPQTTRVRVNLRMFQWAKPLPRDHLDFDEPVSVRKSVQSCTSVLWQHGSLQSSLAMVPFATSF